MCGAVRHDFKALGVVLNRGVQALKDAVDNCPNCILATILQNKLLNDPESGCWTWDYKAAVQEWWSEKNAIARQEEDEFNAAAMMFGNA